jgi:hypothetical protein
MKPCRSQKMFYRIGTGADLIKPFWSKFTLAVLKVAQIYKQIYYELIHNT